MHDPVRWVANWINGDCLSQQQYSTLIPVRWVANWIYCLCRVPEPSPQKKHNIFLNGLPQNLFVLPFPLFFFLGDHFQINPTKDVANQKLLHNIQTQEETIRKSKIHLKTLTTYYAQ